MKRLNYKTEPKQPLDFKWVVRGLEPDGLFDVHYFVTKKRAMVFIRSELKTYPTHRFELFSVSTDFIEAWGS